MSRRHWDWKISQIIDSPKPLYELSSHYAHLNPNSFEPEMYKRKYKKLPQITTHIIQLLKLFHSDYARNLLHDHLYIKPLYIYNNKTTPLYYTDLCCPNYIQMNMHSKIKSKVRFLYDYENNYYSVLPGIPGEQLSFPIQKKAPEKISKKLKY